jgi:hypothetical protein
MDLQVGDLVKVWRESGKQFVECRVLETRTSPEGSPEHLVNWTNMNMRRAEWVCPAQIDRDSVIRRQGS